MSQQVTIDIVSDLSGTSNAHEVPFGWGGKALAIDLTEAEHKTFSDFMQPYVDKARAGSTGSAKRGPGRPKSTAKPTASSPDVASGGSGLTKEERQAVRDYAAEHGHELNKRGRLPSLAITAWQTKNPEVLAHLSAA